MDRDRTLSALISRLEALSAQETMARANEAAHGFARPAPSTPLARTATRLATAWMRLVLVALLAVGALADDRSVEQHATASGVAVCKSP